MPPSPERPDARITALLTLADRGDTSAFEELVPIVYERLRGLARTVLGSDASDHTLQPTALVNLAYLKLAGADADYEGGRRHFFAVAARAMRQILADHARGQQRLKRGGGWHRVTLADDVATRDVETLDLDAALTELAAVRPECAQVVELRYFGGLTSAEIAQAMAISVSSVKNHWRTARAWLQVRLAEDQTR